MPVNGDPEAWIRRFHPAPGSRTTVVCLPHAGGSASYFFPLSQALTPEFEVLAVQYPGRQDRRNEPCFDTIAALADAVFVALQGRLDRKLALFGHSMGATIAFEVARRLELVGVVPEMLFVSGRRAPSCNSDDGVHLLDDAGIVRELQLLNGTNGALFDDQEMLRIILPAIRADYRAIEGYTCAVDTRVASPISVLVGDADPKTTLAAAAAWGEHTSGGLTQRVFPGGHFFLAGCQEDVAGLITATLTLSPRTGSSADPCGA